MAPNGQALTHALQPMHSFSFTITSPFSSFLMAPAGQTSRQGGFAQFLQATGMSIAGSIEVTLSLAFFGFIVLSL